MECLEELSRTIETEGKSWDGVVPWKVDVGHAGDVFGIIWVSNKGRAPHGPTILG